MLSAGNHDFDFGKLLAFPYIIDVCVQYPFALPGYPHLTTLIKDTNFVRTAPTQIEHIQILTQQYSAMAFE